MTLLTRMYDVYPCLVDRIMPSAVKLGKYKYCAVLPFNLPNATSVLNKIVCVCKVYGCDVYWVRTQENILFYYPGEDLCSRILNNQKLLNKIIERVDDLNICDVPKFKGFIDRRRWLFANFKEDSEQKVLLDNSCSFATIQNSTDLFVGHFRFKRKDKKLYCCGKRIAVLP